MSTESVSTEPVAVEVWVDRRHIFVRLADERIVGFPANRFSRLRSAPDQDLRRVKIEAGGFALRWDSLDEDISVPGIVAGRFELPATGPSATGS